MNMTQIITDSVILHKLSRFVYFQFAGKSKQIYTNAII